jgi:hypothetical protein
MGVSWKWIGKSHGLTYTKSWSMTTGWELDARHLWQIQLSLDTEPSFGKKLAKLAAKDFPMIIPTNYAIGRNYAMFQPIQHVIPYDSSWGALSRWYSLLLSGKMRALSMASRDVEKESELIQPTQSG